MILSVLVIQNTDQQFNPIDFLGLQSLNLTQQEHLYNPIMVDMVAFLIESLILELDKDQQEEFLHKFEKVKNNVAAITKLMVDSFSDFEVKRLALLEVYRQEFRLQKFQGYL